MHTLTYNLPNDIHTYVITCNDDMFELYVNLLIDNGAYYIMSNNNVIYDNEINNELSERACKLN